ncbi:hypothetical protein EDD86DRAFT_204346 [Gorgonomyces haynaldii]|nr:hypothetical protein EDD86DRAFT_204346 [Gorgonomyces haynaldii]
MLPPELLLQIFMFTDEETLLTCEQLDRRTRFLIQCHQIVYREALCRKLQRPHKFESPKELLLGWRCLSLNRKQDERGISECPVLVTPLSLAELCISKTSESLQQSKYPRKHPSRLLKLARVGRGSVSLPVMTNDGQELWYEDCGSLIRMELFQWNHNKRLIRIRQNPLAQVQLQPTSRSLYFMAWQMDEEGSRYWIWDPTKTSQFDKNQSWCFENHYPASLCGNLLLLMESHHMHPDTLVCIDLLDGFQHNERWRLDVTGFILQSAMNEMVSCMLCVHDNKQEIRLYNNLDGSQFGRLDLEQCFENSVVEIKLTRFHLIVYNWNMLVVYSIFEDLKRCWSRPLPYVGRPIRLDCSDDGLVWVLAPRLQRG